jgi:hypothetical protein
MSAKLEDIFRSEQLINYSSTIYRSVAPAIQSNMDIYELRHATAIFIGAIGYALANSIYLLFHQSWIIVSLAPLAVLVCILLGWIPALLVLLIFVAQRNTSDELLCLTREQDQCGIIRNSDAYGLGIRLGIYVVNRPRSSGPLWSRDPGPPPHKPGVDPSWCR